MKDNIFTKKNNYTEWKNVKSNLMFGDFHKCPEPKVTIIIPCYNRPNYFRLSLMSALKQECDFTYEIVVVDNNTKDSISPNQIVVEEFNADNVLYYRNEDNIGAIGNFNRGIELARAEYITFCHDDDLLLPTCLKQLMEIQCQTGNRCILSAFNIIDETGNYTRFKSKLHRKKRMRCLIEKPYYIYSLYDQFLSSKGFGVGCLFYRKYLLDLGGYNKDFYPSCDYALHCSYTYYYGCVYNALPTFNYRIAVNDSVVAYVGFNKADNYFRKCMMEKIHLPKFILSFIATALYNINEIKINRYWGHKTDNKKAPLKDIIILKIFSFYSQRIKPFHISFIQ